MEITLLLSYIISVFSLLVIYIFIFTYLKYRNKYHEEQWEPKNYPGVSIIIPAYNEGKYLSQCLESILAVDYPKEKLEVILIDDGSSDDTYEIAKRFESRGITACKKENGGKGAALNYGIAKAQHELVATMDADSYLTKGTIKRMVGFFEDPLVMAASPAVKIQPSEKFLKEIQRIEYLMILFSRKVMSFMDSVPVTPGPFSMFRKKVFDTVGGFSENNLVEDQEMALRIQSHNFRIKSSVDAEVYTEPPEKFADLMKQRVRWQRGGVRNYWHYKYMIRPDYGDFGMYFIPLNFASLLAFFLILILGIYSLVTTPHYIQYIWFDTFIMGISAFTFVWVLLFLIGTFFVFLAVKSFKNEQVKTKYMLVFLFAYWYVMLGYNLIWAYKELKREPTSW